MATDNGHTGLVKLDRHKTYFIQNLVDIWALNALRDIFMKKAWQLPLFLDDRRIHRQGKRAKIDPAAGN